ncbi:DUF2231 domain-containing protein [Nocardioides perillae]|uniref:Uncharacterized protein n=1 Tax=Nocardioides perillae TaxID=1119534 RepID=A0A7Y9RRR9_9ACTN|nr:DUF2231 domain-containing protein [Nocardioides perillae]NYG55387.1 hypothetical protein [Nocardioides perillae]
MTVNGLPLHALVVHAAVVLGPLAAVAGVVLALVPRWRWATRWPTLGLAAAAVVSVVAAYTSGSSHLDANPALAQLPAVATHQERAVVLLAVVAAYGVVAVAAALLLPGPTALASGRGARASRGVVLDRLLVAGVLALSVLMAVYVVLVGDAGARAVWG